MSATEETEQRAGGVSTLELFFDLVFVFTLTQLTAVLADEPSWKGLFQVSLMLGVIFYMYGGYAWLTNSVVVDRLTRRLTLLGGMAGFLVVALAVPGAFEGSGAAFGLAYLAVIVVHLGMFVLSSPMTVKQAMLGLAPFNLLGALLVLAGGILGGTAQYVLWAAAFAVEWVAPRLIDSSGFVIEPGHFVERHGLVVIIAIGESIIAVGIGAAGLPVDEGLVAAAVLGLALSACLWWSYFGSDEGLAEERMEAAPMADRPRLAIYAFGYWHLLILLGVIVVASALKETTAHPFEALEVAKALALGGGVAVLLLGEALFRATLSMGAAPSRGVAGVLALLASAFRETRSAVGARAGTDAQRALRSALRATGITAEHGVMATLNLRVLRPGSSPATDATLVDALAMWDDAESRLELELDARAVAYAMSRQGSLTLEQVYSLLWPRGREARGSGLNAYSRYSDLVRADRVILTSALQDQVPEIPFGPTIVPDVEAALRATGLARVAAPGTSADAAQRLVAELLTRPIDVGSVSGYARVVSASRHAGILAVTLELPEAAG